MPPGKRARRGSAPAGTGEGPVVLSDGFRPFFPGAAVWGVVAMALWVVELARSGWAWAGSPAAAHGTRTRCSGYTSAALAGFLLTAIPKWTGRRPVSGWPLLGLFSLWVAGPLILLWPNALGEAVATLVDASFLPVLTIAYARPLSECDRLRPARAGPRGFRTLSWRADVIPKSNRTAAGQPLHQLVPREVVHEPI